MHRRRWMGLVGSSVAGSLLGCDGTVSTVIGGATPADAGPDTGVDAGRPGTVPAVRIASGEWTPNLDVSGRILDTDWAQLPLGEWVWARTNQIQDLFSTGYPTIVGHPDGLRSLVGGYSGAGWLWDQQRMLITGGGHGDSHPSENAIVELDTSTARFSVFAPRSAMASARYSSGTSGYTLGVQGAGNDCPDLEGRAPAIHTYDGFSYFPPGASGGAPQGLLLTFGSTVSVWDVASKSVDTPHFRHDASGVLPQNGGYFICLGKYPYMLAVKDSFFANVFDLSQREETSYSLHPEGAPLPEPTSRGRYARSIDVGFTFVYARKMLGMDEKRYRCFLVCVDTDGVRAYRIAYGDALDEMHATGDWNVFSRHVTRCALTGPDAADLNPEDLHDQNGSPLGGCGIGYDEHSDCLWVTGNMLGNRTWRIDGVSTSSWTVTRLLGAAALASNTVGTYGRHRVARHGVAERECTVLWRVSSTTAHPEVMRVSAPR